MFAGGITSRPHAPQELKAERDRIMEEREAGGGHLDSLREQNERLAVIADECDELERELEELERCACGVVWVCLYMLSNSASRYCMMQEANDSRRN